MKAMRVIMREVITVAAVTLAAASAGLPAARGIPREKASQAVGVVVKARLVLEGNEQVSDWQILVAPGLSAEQPRDGAGRPMGMTPADDGTLALHIPPGGVVYVCPYVGGRLAADDVIPVRVAPEEEREEELTIKPAPPRNQVAFALQRDDGEPLGRKVKVHLYNVYGEVDADAGPTLSDDAGVARFGRLPCTRYDLWIEGPAEPAGADGDDVPAILFRALDVKPGDGAQTIELTVPRAGSVKGRLLRVDGKTPAAGHVVAVRTGTVPDEETDPARRIAAYARGAQGCYAEAEVAADGTFVLRGLTPGEHSLDVRRPDQLEPWCTISGVEVVSRVVMDLGAVEVAWNGWQHMFDRKTLDGWAESDFYGQKEVRIENDRILLSQGRDMTGITWKKELPRVDYEVSLDAMRVGGDDFFCGLTFPVQKDYCSLILGGWGGSVVGLSSLDGYDASENETSDWIQFDNKRWYRVRVRVTKSKIEAWLDGENIVDVDTKDRDIDTRIEVEPSKPFGVATWCTSGAVRDIRMRWLDTKAP